MDTWPAAEESGMLADASVCYLVLAFTHTPQGVDTLMKVYAHWLIAILLFSPFAQAAPITVTNPGFEANVLADGFFTVGIVTGWTLSGSAGAFNPTIASFPGEAPEGSNTAFSNGPTLTQTVSTAVAGTLYTLTVLVGARADIPGFFPGYTVALQINGSTVASASSPTPADGTFSLVTVQYTAGGPDDGLPLGILLDSIGIQTNFDLVQLDAAAPPGFSKTFAPTIVAVGGISTLTFTIDNSANGTAIGSLDFIDNLPAGMLVATPSNTSTTCSGGSLTAITGTNSISYTGGTVAASTSCTITADVVTASPGVLVNTSGALTSDAGNSGTAGSTLIAVAAPVFTKTFAPNPVVIVATSTLTFTIDNASNAAAATSLDFTDTLPTGMVVASPPNASTTCTGGTLTAVSGAGDISYTGGTVSAFASCSVGVDVSFYEAGDLENVSGDLTSSAGNSGPASSTLSVTAPTTNPIPTLTWTALFALILLILGTGIVKKRRPGSE